MTTTRRRFLGGAGALVALPFLESLLPRSARAQQERPKRFIVIYVPNGIHARDWLPETIGSGFELKPALESLAPFKDRLTVISNLQNVVAEKGEDGDHARGTGSFLTGSVILQSEERLGNSVSLDQALVQALSPPTRFPSLQLGLEGGAYSQGCDEGYSCAYSRNISWSGPSTPLPKIVSPDLLFDRMFAGTEAGATIAEAARRKRLKKSVLDSVRSEAESLETVLGSSDRRKLDEYFSGLRELETRLGAGVPSGACAAGAPDERQKDDFVRQSRAMVDLIVSALQCDVTRFITYMLANSGSNRSYEQLGIRGDHHDVSHHDDDPERLENYRAICRWEVEQMSYLLQRMSAVQEEGGTLLDNSLVFFSTEISDGNRHDHLNLPVVLAGNVLSPRGHLRAPEREPIANLFLSILRAFGAPAPSFGRDGTRPLEGL